jgi:MFS family permease
MPANISSGLRLSRARWAVSLAGFLSFVNLYAPQAMLTGLTEGLHTDAQWIGLTISMATLAVAVSGPFVGMFADMTGRKLVIVPSALVLVVPTVLLAYTDSLSQFLALRFMQGLCTPAIFGVVVAYVSEEWPPSQIPKVMTWYITGTIMGGFSGRFIAALVTASFPWQDTYLALGGTTAFLALLVWIFLPPAQNFKPTGKVLETLRLMQGHASNPRLLGTCAVGAMMLFSLVGCFTFIDFYLAAPPFGLSGTELGSVFAVYMVAVVISPITARMVGRFGRRVTLVISLSLGVLGLLLTLVPSVPVSVFGLALFSAFIFVTHGMAMGTVGIVTRSARSAAVGVYVTFYYTGGSLGAFVPSAAWTYGGWPGCVAVLIGGLVLAGSAGLWAWRPPLGPPPDGTELPTVVAELP